VVALRSKTRKAKHGDRDGVQFIALPMVVLRCERFAALPPSAVKLLMDFCVQSNGNNNGDLSAAMTTLRKRGWTSTVTLARALAALLNAGFVARTRLGNRHRCALFGLTWFRLDPSEKMDAGLVTQFRRGAYMGAVGAKAEMVKAPAFRPGKRLFGASESGAQNAGLLQKVKHREIEEPRLLQKVKQSAAFP
jgi:hypothetical protein